MEKKLSDCMCANHGVNNYVTLDCIIQCCLQRNWNKIQVKGGGGVGIQLQGV